jgi:glutamyl-tRNA reductase
LSLLVVGLEPERTPVELLERVSVPDEQLDKVLAGLRDRSNLAEVVVVSTCLRTEVYAVAERFHDGVADIQGFLADRAGTSTDELVSHVSLWFDDQVTEHLFEVAAGLRSAVLGETEVLGQVRRAAERAAAARAAGPVLTDLFRRAVGAGRRVRTDTAIARGSLSLSHVAVELVADRVGSLAGRRVVVIGAGEMGQGVVDALGRAGAHVVVANRTVARAAALAEPVGGRAVTLGSVAAELAVADAAVCCSGATAPVVATEVWADAAGRRVARSPLVVVDLGMPRNVDPVVGALDGVALFDMAALRQRADAAMAERRAELDAAAAIVRAEAARYRADLRARGAAPVVAALRSRVEELRDQALARERSRFPDLDDEQWSAVEAVVRDLVARLVHQPTVALKETAGTPRGDRLVEAVHTLFDL